MDFFSLATLFFLLEPLCAMPRRLAATADGLCNVLVAPDKKCGQPLCNLSLPLVSGGRERGCYTHCRMLQQPPAGKPWAAGKDAAERSKLFCTFVAAGNFLPEITDADAIAANAAHSDKAVSCCQRQR